MGTHELGLFQGNESWRRQARDRAGRFVRVRLTAERRLVLTKAALMRSEMGLPPDPRLHPKEGARR
jgi:hypothetical protein